MSYFFHLATRLLEYKSDATVRCYIRKIPCSSFQFLHPTFTWPLVRCKKIIIRNAHNRRYRRHIGQTCTMPHQRATQISRSHDKRILSEPAEASSVNLSIKEDRHHQRRIRRPGKCPEICAGIRCCGVLLLWGSGAYDAWTGISRVTLRLTTPRYHAMLFFRRSQLKS